MSTLNRQPGRAWAYTGAILGGLVSVAANVAHSFIPPTGSPNGWHPEAGAVVGAIVWPVFLFIAIEILARVNWPSGFWWGLIRWGGLLPVALVAAFVSYRHLSGLLAHYHEEPIVTWLGPLAVDGLMAMATGALIATSTRAHRAPTTVTAPAAPDVLSAPAPTAVTLPTTSTPDSEPVPTPAPRKAPARKATAKKATATKAPATSRPAAPRKTTKSAISVVASGNAPGESAVSTASPAPDVPTAPAQAPAPSTTDTLVTSVDAAQPLKTPVPAALLTRAAHIAEAHRTATGTPITAGELAVRMRVNSDTAAQLLAVLDLRPDSPTRPVATVNGKPTTATR